MPPLGTRVGADPKADPDALRSTHSGHWQSHQLAGAFPYDGRPFRRFSETLNPNIAHSCAASRTVGALTTVKIPFTPPPHVPFVLMYRVKLFKVLISPVSLPSPMNCCPES